MPKVGQHFVKARTRTCTCRYCSSSFLAADVKASVCSLCLTTRGSCSCGRGKGVGSRFCVRCARENPSAAEALGHKKQAAAIRGSHNPAKRSSTRKKISAAVKANHWSRLYPRKFAVHMVEIRRRATFGHPSSLEAALGRCLSAERQYPVGPYKVDFAYPTLKIALEVYGCYWHSCTLCGFSVETLAQKANYRADRARRSFLRNRGWKLVEIWEHSLRRSLCLSL